MRMSLSMSEYEMTEFDLSPAFAREATDASDRTLLEDLFHVASLTVIVSATRNPSHERVVFQERQRADLGALSSQLKERMFQTARAGERVAAILDANHALAFLLKHGYVASVTKADSNPEIEAWLKYASQAAVAPASVIVIGHDFDPLFLILPARGTIALGEP